MVSCKDSEFKSDYIFKYKLQCKTLPVFFSNFKLTLFSHIHDHDTRNRSLLYPERVYFHIFMIMTQEIVIYYTQREYTMNLQSIMFVTKSEIF